MNAARRLNVATARRLGPSEEKPMHPRHIDSTPIASSLVKSSAALLIGASVAAFASPAFAIDTQPPPPNPTKITEHRAAALEKCTSGIRFASDHYVACMEQENEAP
jgi:hypothetical protein